jgi:putative ABC transport system permease protein
MNMIFNYLKISFRSMLREKSFSMINIAGLSIGLVTFLAISLYVVDEFSYDQYHEKKDRIYRAIINASFDGQVHKWGAVPNQVAPTAAKEIPEIEKTTRLFHHNFGDIAFISTPDEKFSETQLFYADSEIFDIFSISLLQGNSKKVLDRPGTVIISESSAKKYFGNDSPIGQVLTVDSRTELEVTGVYKDFPATSFLKCNLIASFSSNWFGQEKNLSWGNASFDTFFLLQPGTTKEVAEEKIEGMLTKNLEKDNRWFNISLQALTDIRLYSGDLTQNFDKKEYGNIEQIKILGALASIILIIAAINYMNLTTAQSQRRNKEVGISKTLGATALQLKGKFFLEASVYVFVAMMVSLFLFSHALPALNQLSGKSITMTFMSTPEFWVSSVCIWLVLSLLAGSYPAIYLSSFSPKATLQNSKGGAWQSSIRKGLVITQFTASFILIISSILFYKQMNYISNKNLGYKPEQVIAVMTSATKDQTLINSLKTEFESLSEVKNVCRSQSYPGIGTSGYSIKKSVTDEQGASISSTRATHEIIDVLGIKLLAGKSLPERKEPTDTTIQVLLNKSAVAYLQLTPEEAIGKQVHIFNNQPAEVVGVADDFHFASMHQQIGPYCFTNNTDNGFIYLLVKVDTQDLPATLTKLQQTYSKIIPAAFEYTFIDDKMASLYKSEKKLTETVLIASAIAIFIACLGLYALAAYTAEQRTKEIGIRKVLGASVPHLVAMLSKDFMKLVAVALSIGLPVGYYLIDKWLEGFAYKTTITATSFIIAILATAFIAFLTVSFKSFSSASANPVHSLKNE